MKATQSQQVSWWSAHEYVAPVLARIGSWPMVGTPAWCELADDDPVKVAAIFDAAQHWALRLETCQKARCEASRDVSAAEDWPAIPNIWRRRKVAIRDGAYIPREVA